MPSPQGGSLWPQPPAPCPSPTVLPDVPPAGHPAEGACGEVGAGWNQRDGSDGAGEGHGARQLQQSHVATLEGVPVEGGVLDDMDDSCRDGVPGTGVQDSLSQLDPQVLRVREAGQGAERTRWALRTCAGGFSCPQLALRRRGHGADGPSALPWPSVSDPGVRNTGHSLWALVPERPCPAGRESRVNSSSR